jgi:outer membrane protein assembly factor BamB
VSEKTSGNKHPVTTSELSGTTSGNRHRENHSNFLLCFCYRYYLGFIMKDKANVNCGLIAAVVVCMLLSFSARSGLAVSSKITRHSSSADFLEGQTQDIVIGSQGTLGLGRAAEVLVEEFHGTSDFQKGAKCESQPWSINSIVANGEEVFVGTSPNGGIYKYSLGKLTRIYPLESDNPLRRVKQESTEPNPPPRTDEVAYNLLVDANVVETGQYLSNEHVFAMATDVAGRLLAGISGEKCELIRFEEEMVETVFEPNGAKYIFAIVVDDGGDIYLGTGPEGKVYRLDAFCKDAELIYDSRDKNILSLAIGEEGHVYAGSDSRGLVYKINPRTKTATVLYDSDQPEITALLFLGQDELYAAGTSAEVVEAEMKLPSKPPSPPGRPEVDTESEEKESAAVILEGLKLTIANTDKKAEDKLPLRHKPPSKAAKPGQVSYIHKITTEGFVTNIFSEAAVFFCMAEEKNRLLVGTGNSGQLFTIEPGSEEEAIIYEDEQAPQITAVTVSGEEVYLGMANPAKLVKLRKVFATEGTYTSALIDAGQPAKWGKLQIEADIPQGSKVMVACRSGNVDDVNDSTFSEWSEQVEVTEPVQLRCPVGRFCQYKLVLQGQDGQESPLVREVAVANTISNLEPKVEEVRVELEEAADKKGIFKISYKAKDDNNDNLIYKMDFRKIGRSMWKMVDTKSELPQVMNEIIAPRPVFPAAG